MTSSQRDDPAVRMIRNIAVAVVLLVGAYYLWQFTPKNSGPLVANSPACQIFDSIPPAPQYASPPPMMIDPAQLYVATIKLEKGGEIQIKLLPDKAPVAVNSFVFLACKKFFDGLTFHRVLPAFMAQAGDPTGTGSGGPGYSFDNEISDLKFDKAGVVGMANTGQPASNGSQFFITVGSTPQLDGGYTIFGQVTAGMEVVRSIKLRDPQQNPAFEGDKISTITIMQE